jgi:hypothetical protein
MLTQTSEATVETPEFIAKLGRWFRSLLCVMYNGNHELYREYNDTEVYQRCLLCDHRTTGWKIDRMDRRRR